VEIWYVSINTYPGIITDMSKIFLKVSKNDDKVKYLLLDREIGIEPTLFQHGKLVHHHLCVSREWRPTELHGHLRSFNPTYRLPIRDLHGGDGWD
jgi:hypothetical protein